MRNDKAEQIQTFKNTINYKQEVSFNILNICGDGDFFGRLESLSTWGCEISLVYPPNTVNGKLFEIADHSLSIEKIKMELERNLCPHTLVPPSLVPPLVPANAGLHPPS